MADHIRKQVRDAVVMALTGLPTTGANVFTARVSALEAGELPGWLVRLRDEAGSWDAVGAIARGGQLVIEGRAQGGDGLEDTLDRMAAEAETALYDGSSALAALLMNIGPPTTAIDLPEDEDGHARRLGVIRILVPVTYRSRESDPTTRA